MTESNATSAFEPGQRSISYAAPSGHPRALRSPGGRMLRRVHTLSAFASLGRPSFSSEQTAQREPEWTIFGELLLPPESGRLPIPSTPPKSPLLPRTRSPKSSHTTLSEPQSPDSFSTFRIHSPEPEPRLPLSAQEPNNRLLERVPEEAAPNDDRNRKSSPILAPVLKYLTLSFLDRQHKDIIKCVLAYYIGSLFTFVPALSGLISGIMSQDPLLNPSPSTHMVSTVAVLYSPAKTVGAMVEADVFLVASCLVVFLLCLCATGNFWAFEIHPGLEWLADVSILLWLGAVMSFIAWAKLWMDRPSFGSACSMAVIILCVVIVKEGGLSSMFSVVFLIFVGTAVSNFVCFVIWPESATTRLRTNLSKSLQSLSTLLRLIGDSFLVEGDNVSTEKSTQSDNNLLDAIEGLQAVFTHLKSDLEEARSEWLDVRLAASSQYEAAIETLTHLAQHMTGLRDGAKLHNDLHINVASPDGKIPIDGSDSSGQYSAMAVFTTVKRDLGAPLEALIRASCASLDGARTIFETSGGCRVDLFDDLEGPLTQTLARFRDVSNRMVLDLYRGSSGEDILSTANCDRNEAVFHVYFFIFTLQEFAKETITLLESMDKIRRVDLSLRSAPLLGSRTLARLFPSHSRHLKGQQPLPAKSGERRLQKRLSTLFTQDTKSSSAMFPNLRPHASNTAQTPGRMSLSVVWRLKRRLWIIGARLKSPEVKYAMKTGMATAALAAPAFFERTRPYFTEYRGEWALITFFFTIGPTIGATNLLGLQRILGTIGGALVAAAVFSFFKDSPFVLSLAGGLFSVPCFYLVVQRPEHATSAKIVLLTYNLICLYCYNQRDVPIEVVGVKRSTAVNIGVAWAFIVSRWWWPLEARRQLGISLSEFCQEISWMYNRLVRTYSIPPAILFRHTRTTAAESQWTERSPLLAATNSQAYHGQDFASMELHLQVKLIELQSLLAHTEHEPRLKGPFPIALYRSVLTSLQVILDKLHSMRCVTMREEWFTAVHRDFIMPVQRQRREMVGNVILYFSTLSAAFMLKAPLPPYLPPAEQSRLRLMEAIRAVDVGRDSKDSRHLLYYAYASAMGGVIQELEQLGKMLQTAFGVIGDSTSDFEELFDNAQIEAALQSPQSP